MKLLGTRPVWIGRALLCAGALVAGMALGLRPAAAAPEAELYASLEEFHGHTCAGSLFGARLGHAALKALDADGKLKAEYFDLSCPVDGIQMTTGLTVGNRALVVEDRDEHRLVLTEVATGRQVAARLTDGAMSRGKEYRARSGELRALPASSTEAPAIRREIEAVLDWLRTAPDAEVVVVEAVESIEGAHKH